ncbi:GAF domain-containing protein [Nakamurella flava]|uniref:GAF domain-containing protein n=1 Tax=Nakamurella flava TaxID=2576308 RepID=A0A4U6Q992_9ACTN|nr:GAF domain-containing protein [Nakamurella flava]
MAGCAHTPSVDTDLTRLLQTVPDEIDSAASHVAQAAGDLLRTAVSVAGWTGHRWVALAGPVVPLPGHPLPGTAPGRAGTPDGRIVLCWDPSIAAAEAQPLLVQACVWLALLHRSRGTQGPATATPDAESLAVREVVQQLLTVRDLDRVMTAIAERTLRLLDADICGVMLRDGDVVDMRACVGNRCRETTRLRMRRGQGLAGLVFDTGRPAKVDSYLDDQTISDDFMSLAQREETLSALAVPLSLQGEFLGVLEVWRRRASIFTEQDVRRMVTLADIATVAIDNARQHDVGAAATAEAEAARDELQRQVAVLDHSSRLQHSLLTTVVEGGGLPAVVHAVGTEMGCEVAVFGPDGSSLAAHHPDGADPVLPERLALRSMGRPDPVGSGRWSRPVYADGDRVGQVVLVQGVQSAELMTAVVGHVAMACSLASLRERAASRARAQAVDQVLWDLLQGPVEHRVAARSRAQQLGITLPGALRVLHARLENIEDLAAAQGWDTSQTDKVRRSVLRVVKDVDSARRLVLVGMRGDLLVGVGGDLTRDAARQLAAAARAAVHAERPGLQLTWGVSREHDNPIELPNALREAETALAAARRLGGREAFLYEELGIVRLLLGSGDDPDLQTFIDEVTGPLIAYDHDNDGALIRTLRAFFDADCSQRVAAERLFIHHKTMRYRLERIRQLTGLDLNRHEDRMRADFALRLLEINQPTDEPDARPQPAL